MTTTERLGDRLPDAEQTILDFALRYIRRGFAVVPIPHGHSERDLLSQACTFVAKVLRGNR